MLEAFPLCSRKSLKDFDTLQECHSIIDAIEAQKEGIKTLESTVQETLGEAFDRYLKSEVADVTKRNVRQTISSIPKETPLVSIGEEWLRKYFLQASWKPSTVRTKMLNLRGVLSNAREAGRAVNPTAYFKLPRSQNASAFGKYVATESDYNRFLTYASTLDWRMQLVFQAIAAWGIRVGNMMRLQLGHKTNEGSIFVLPANLTKQNKDQYLPVYPEISGLIGKAMLGNKQWVFERSFGRAYTEEAVRSAWRRMRVETGLPMALTPYSFRRRADRRLAERGLNPQMHASIMGHSLGTITRSYMTQDVTKMLAALTVPADETGKSFGIQVNGVWKRFGTLEELQAFQRGSVA